MALSHGGLISNNNCSIITAQREASSRAALSKNAESIEADICPPLSNCSPMSGKNFLPSHFPAAAEDPVGVSSSGQMGTRYLAFLKARPRAQRITVLVTLVSLAHLPRSQLPDVLLSAELPLPKSKAEPN